MTAHSINELIRRSAGHQTRVLVRGDQSEHVGSIEGGKLADLVLYKPAYFGVKPELVLKGGLLVSAQMGDPNASIATPQPVYMRPQFAAYGRALSKSCLTFVSKASLKNGIAERYGLQREVVAVEHCRDRQQSARLRHILRPLGSWRTSPAVKSIRTAIAWPMANDPPFANLNHLQAICGSPRESPTQRVGIR